MSYHRSQEEKRRLKKLYNTIGVRYWPGGAWYSDKKERYVRYWRSGHHSKYCKFCQRQANRAVRRARHVDSYSHYRKLYDYWWEIT